MVDVFGYPRVFGNPLGLSANADGIVIYVNSSTGNDSNNGLSPALPKLTLDGARLALVALGAIGTIKVTAPEATPVQGFVDFSSGQTTIEGLNGVTWHCQRVTTIAAGAGGWTNEGGGIYSRASSASSALWYVATLPDGNGLQTILTQETGTPNAPSAGEFGYVVNVLYVHLPGDVDPNLHQFKRASTNFNLRASGTAKLTLRNLVARYSNGAVIECSAAGASIFAENCDFDYGAIGISDSAAGRIICNSCRARRNINDGFNANFATWTLNSCEGAYNDDEGASPHQTSSLTINGGRYHHNGHGGLTAVNSAIMVLNQVEVDNNGVNAGAAGERGGINYLTTSTGSCTGCNTHDNTGEGFNCTSSATVKPTVSGLISTDNTEVDVFCP